MICIKPIRELFQLAFGLYCRMYRSLSVISRLGLAITISGGLTSWIRGLWNEAYGLPDVVNKCSGWYKRRK